MVSFLPLYCILFPPLCREIEKLLQFPFWTLKKTDIQNWVVVVVVNQDEGSVFIFIFCPEKSKKCSKITEIKSSSMKNELQHLQTPKSLKVSKWSAKVEGYKLWEIMNIDFINNQQNANHGRLAQLPDPERIPPMHDILDIWICFYHSNINESA